jgi:hypothetical protein
MIIVKLGSIETSWEVVETDAPKEYDGFGTFQLTDCGGERIVMVRTEHWDWQTNRYASGVHWFRASSVPDKDIENALFARLRGGQ